MSMTKVTSKGQVTLPADIRKELGIERGDDLVFELAPDRTMRVRVVKHRRLSDFYGALPATRPFPGKEAVREEAGQALGRRKRDKSP